MRVDRIATYKGRRYRVLFSGGTRFGHRTKLAYLEGGKEFWVDTSKLDPEKATQTAKLEPAPAVQKLVATPTPKISTEDGHVIRAAMTDVLAKMVRDHEEAIRNFEPSRMPAHVLQAHGRQIKETRLKIEAYAGYLLGSREDLLASLARADVALKAKVKQSANTQKLEVSPALFQAEASEAEAEQLWQDHLDDQAERQWEEIGSVSARQALRRRFA